MGGATKLLVNFPFMEVSSLSESLRFGVADIRLFLIPGMLKSLASWAVLVPLFPMEILGPVLSLEAGVKVLVI